MERRFVSRYIYIYTRKRLKKILWRTANEILTNSNDLSLVTELIALESAPSLFLRFSLSQFLPRSILLPLSTRGRRRRRRRRRMTLPYMFVTRAFERNVERKFRRVLVSPLIRAAGEERQQIAEYITTYNFRRPNSPKM